MATESSLIIKKINLLPRAIQKRLAYTRLIPFAVIGVLTGLGLVGAGWMALGQYDTVLAHQVEQLSTRNASRAAQVNRDKAQYMVDPSVEQRLAVLTSMVAQELEWPKVFALVNLTLAKDVRATQIVITRDPLKPTVLHFTVGGSAPSNVSFAEFRESLLANADLQGVKVDTYAFAPETGIVSFAVSFSYPIADLLFTNPAKPGN